MPQTFAAAQHKDVPHKEIRPLIFFDMDGVVADFYGHAVRENKIGSDGKCKFDEMDAVWWAGIPPFPGAKAFYDAACALGQTRFLSGPALNPDCFSGKARWVMTFVPARGKSIIGDLIICRSVNKHLLAGPARILIDDSARNIKEWRAAGGIGILHEGDYAETLKELRNVVAALTVASKPVSKADRRRPSRRFPPKFS